MKILSASLVATALAACGGPSYVYTPETANVMTSSGLPVAKVDIPQESPQGSIQIESFGVTTLDQGGASVHALHVRETVSNDGDATPWQLDTRQQLVAISNEGQSRAVYATADTRALPLVPIARREKRVIDLYFPLPTTVQSDRQLPHFDVLWQVDTGTRAIASRTTFDRQEIAGDFAYAYPYPYYGGVAPYWWYDPFYPGAVFVHARPFVVHGGPVHVGHFDGHFAHGAPAGHVAGGHMGGGHVSPVASSHHR
jgi:hypothetical protein